MKKMYHATAFENLGSILESGLEANRSLEKCVFLCEKPEEAATFAKLHGCNVVLVCECKVDEKKLIESFDHNRNFIPFRAWMYPGDIPTSQITNYLKFGGK